MKLKSCLALFLVSAAALSADTIASWTFETTQPTTSGPLLPEIGAGSASSNTGGTFSSPAGWSTAKSWSSNGWAVGEYFQFELSTVGFTDISVSWQQTGSNTGPKNFALEYSNDGLSFLSFGTYTVTNDGWNTTSAPVASVKTFDLSAISGIENDSSVFFRLVVLDTVSINNGTVAAGGTGRVDSFTVSGSAIPEPGAYASILGAVALAGVATRRRRA